MLFLVKHNNRHALSCHLPFGCSLECNFNVLSIAHSFFLELFSDSDTFPYSHTSSSMKQSEASVLTVADLADLFTEETEELE